MSPFFLCSVKNGLNNSQRNSSNRMCSTWFEEIQQRGMDKLRGRISVQRLSPLETDRQCNFPSCGFSSKTPSSSSLRVHPLGSQVFSISIKSEFAIRDSWKVFALIKVQINVINCRFFVALELEKKLMGDKNLVVTKNYSQLNISWFRKQRALILL